MRIVVEVGSARAMVEKPRLVSGGHAFYEFDRIAAPFLIQKRQHRNCNLFDILGAAALARMYEAFVEGHVLDPLGARVRVDHLGKEVWVAPLRIHVGNRQKPIKVIEADILRL